MEQQHLKEYMSFNKDDHKNIPLAVFEINESYIVGVYQGALSKFDILIKYRQKLNGSWSRIRTPKHIHWAVDILIKLHEDKTKTQEFLDFLIDVWKNTYPIKTEEQQRDLLNIETLFKDSQSLIIQYESLSSKG